MKRLDILKTTFLLVAITFMHPTFAAGPVIKGGKTQITKCFDIDLQDVEKISVQKAIDLEIIESQSSSIEVTINDNLLEYFRLEVKGRELRISLKDKFSYGNNIHIEVKLPYNNRYNSFSAEAASSIRSQVDIIAPSLDIEASAASKVELAAAVSGNCRVDVEAASKVVLIAAIKGDCKVDVEAASKAELTISAQQLSATIEALSMVEAEGWVDRLRVEAEALAKFDGAKLECAHGDLQAAALSNIVYSSPGSFSSSKEGLSSIENRR